MKRIISLMLAVILVFGAALNLASCEVDLGGNESDGEATLKDAVNYLKEEYGDLDGEETDEDFTLPTKIKVDGTKFTVEWSVNTSVITVTNGKSECTVDLPDENEEELDYTLTATIENSEGDTKTFKIRPVLPIYGGDTPNPNPNPNPNPHPNPEPNPDNAPTVEDAAAFHRAMYRDLDGEYTYSDFDLVRYIYLNGSEFSVSYNINDTAIAFYYDVARDVYVADLPDSNDTERSYDIVVTINNDLGLFYSYVISPIIPVYGDNYEATSLLFEDTAYKLTIHQNNLGKILYMTTDSSQEKYMLTTTDPIAAPDWYVQITSGGYYFFTYIGGMKYYIYAVSYPKDSTETVFTTAIRLSTDNASVFYFEADISSWVTVPEAINTSSNVEMLQHVLGTYSTYETVSLSVISYYTPDTVGQSQFPLQFITKEKAEQMEPTTGPEAPTELSSFTEIIEIGSSMMHNTYTVEKYLIEGVITDIVNTTYGNLYITDGYGNTIYLYGLYSEDGSIRFDGMDTPPAVGDTIRVLGVVGQYNGVVQMKNGYLLSHVIAAAQSINNQLTEEAANFSLLTWVTAGSHYSLPSSGSIYDGISISWYLPSEEYASLNGNEIVFYDYAIGQIPVIATFSKEGYTYSQQYTFIIHNPYEISIPQANSIAAECGKGGITEEMYFISGTVYEITNTHNGHMYIVDEDGYSILLNYLYSRDGAVLYNAMDVKPQVGDTILIYAYIGQTSTGIYMLYQACLYDIW